jgi:O-antigen/teichoic acid export membrane protein
MTLHTMGTHTQSASYQIVKDSLKYVPSNVVPALLALVSISLFTRLILPEEYAKYTLVLTSITLVSNVAFAWLNFSGFRFYDESRDDMGSFMSTCMLSVLLVLFCIIVGGYLFLKFLNMLGIVHNLDDIFLISALFLTVKVGFDQILIFMRADRNATRHSIFKVIDALIKLTVAVILIKFFNMKYLGIVLGIIISYLVLTIVELLINPIYRSIRVHGFSKEKFVSMLHYGFPLIGTGVMGTLLSIGDRYMLAYFSDFKQIGIYSVGYRFAEMAIETPGSILLMAYFPILIHQFNISQNEFSLVLKQALQLIIIILVPITFGTIILSRDLVELFLAGTYQEVYIVFFWVCIGILFSYLNHLFTRIFELKKVTKYVLYISAVAAALNILMNFILIPIYGYYGAAIATTAAYAMQLFLSFLISRRFIIVPLPLHTMANVLICSTAMCAGIYFMSLFLNSTTWTILGAKVLLGIIIYLSTLLMLREPVLKSLYAQLRN